MLDGALLLGCDGLLCRDVDVNDLQWRCEAAEQAHATLQMQVLVYSSHYQTNLIFNVLPPRTLEMLEMQTLLQEQ